MIDEDLYKIATDELNSDARKPDVWARACALASDDHDEARFLYTNLRVEEMLNKDGKQRTFSTNDQQRSTNTDGAAPINALELDKAASNGSESLDSLELSLDNNVASIDSSHRGVNSLKTPKSTDEVDAIEIGDLDAPTSASGTDALSDKVVEFDDETMAELAELSNENSNDSNVVASIAENTDNTSQLNKSTIETSDVVTNVFKTPEAANREQISSQSHDLELEQTTESSPPLDKSEHQSQQMSVDRSEIDGEPLPNLDDLDATTDTAHMNPAYDTYKVDAASETEQEQTLAHSAPYNYSESESVQLSDTNQLLDDDGTMGLTSEFDTELGRSYMVFNRHGALKAVKRGISWPALFITFPWLLSKALFGTALVYGCLWLVSLGGLLSSANRWINAGTDASMNIKLWTGAFALLTVIGLLYIPFRYGNRWVAEKLQNRGFRYEGSMNAENKLDAVDRLIRYNEEKTQ